MLLNFKDLNYRRFGVSVKYYKAGQQKTYKRMDYDAIVNVTESNPGWEIAVAKENILFNQHQPDAVNEVLSEYLTNSLYPVHTVINDQFLNIKGITNHDQLLERWESNKSKILEKYAGKTIEELIQVTDRKFKDKFLIEKSMKYDMFWNLFFHPKHLSYTENHSIKTDLNLAVAPYKFPVRFSGTQSINPEMTSYKSIQVRFDSDELEVPDFLIPITKGVSREYQMKLEVIFDLDAKHLFPMHTRACFELYYRDAENNIQSEKKIDFTMYQLDTVSGDDKLNILVKEEETKRSKLMKFIDALVGD